MGETQTLYARGWLVKPAPVHVWRRSPEQQRLQAELLNPVQPGSGSVSCGAEDPWWVIGPGAPMWDEEPCPDCLAVLAAETAAERAVDWAGADDILAEWG